MKLLTAAIALTAPAVALAAPAADPVKTYIEAGFAAMDANRNGQVDRAEFDRFMRARLAQQAKAFDAAFAELDKDGSGKIDQTEAATNPVLLDNFAQMDADGDGSLSKEELRAAAIAAQAVGAGAE